MIQTVHTHAARTRGDVIEVYVGDRKGLRLGGALMAAIYAVALTASWLFFPQVLPLGAASALFVLVGIIVFAKWTRELSVEEGTLVVRHGIGSVRLTRRYPCSEIDSVATSVAGRNRRFELLKNDGSRTVLFAVELSDDDARQLTRRIESLIAV